MTLIDTYQAKGFDLRPMAERDLLEVVQIEEICGLSRWGRDGYRTELLSEVDGLMLIASPLSNARNPADERIAGFIAARLMADELHINNVAVRQQYRRSGIGGALLSAVMERGKQQGARKAFLEVRVSNAPARALYERHGFEIVGKRPDYYTQPVEDALVMVVML
ncbi:MAG TPA: ribosomal protein S18-alanine N-acetyltransferase [Pyrinomonadaceae bacterium]|jgi:ribosomal-protein-alanine N-acetyltransferase